MADVAIIGAGSWGIALAKVLHTNGNKVTVWSIVEDEITMLKEKHEHVQKLPGVKLPEDKFQILDEDIAVYPDTVLCNPSENSISIHVFTGTWLEGKKALARKINVFLKIHVTNKKRAKLFRKYIMRV